MGLAVFQVVHEVYKIWIRLTLYHMPWVDLLPIQICNLLAFLTAIVLVWRTYALYELVYFWGLGGTFLAILTPDRREGGGQDALDEGAELQPTTTAWARPAPTSSGGWLRDVSSSPRHVSRDEPRAESGPRRAPRRSTAARSGERAARSARDASTGRSAARRSPSTAVGPSPARCPSPPHSRRNALCDALGVCAENWRRMRRPLLPLRRYYWEDASSEEGAGGSFSVRNSRAAARKLAAWLNISSTRSPLTRFSAS